MPRDEEVTPRAGSRQALTGFPRPACSALLPPGAPAWLADMGDHPLAGQPRPNRRSRPSDPSPVPTMADTWLVMRTDLKPHPLPAVHGHRLGMSQAHANTGRHLLPTGRQQA